MDSTLKEIRKTIQEQKRTELRTAWEAGAVNDPVTFTVLGSHFLGSLVLGAGVSVATSLAMAGYSPLLDALKRRREASC